MRKKPELMSPVFDFTSLKAAIDAGADAVYFGVKGLNMRATAKNFTATDLKKVVNLCHKSKVKAYLALNIIIYDTELKKVKNIVQKAKNAGIDAIICWDPSVISEVKKAKIPFHISTQASISNIETAKFYKKLGAERIVLARELNLKQILDIKKKVKIEVECFIHGAMCVSISGRCFMSQFTFGRSANRGDCLQPCRRKYEVNIKDVEEGHELCLGKDYVMSPKDLCVLPFIDKLMKIDVFKIEGRARSPEYVKIVTEVYREAIDSYFEKKLDEKIKKKLMKKLETVYNRGFSSGFFLAKPLKEWTKPDTKATQKKIFVGLVKNYYPKPTVAEIKIQSGSISLNDTIMFQGPTTGVFEQCVSSMQIDKKEVKSVSKGKSVGIKVKSVVRKNDKVYLIKKR